MAEIIFQIWYFIVILPYFIFVEAHGMFTNFLKKRALYQHWDMLHSLVVFLIFLLIIFWSAGFR